jgi:hypothetical protein
VYQMPHKNHKYCLHHKITKCYLNMLAWLHEHELPLSIVILQPNTNCSFATIFCNGNVLIPIQFCTNSIRNKLG